MGLGAAFDASECKKRFDHLQFQTTGMAWTSERAEITLPQRDRTRLKIDPSATTYAWIYPLDIVSDLKKDQHFWDEIKQELLTIYNDDQI